MGTMQCIDEMRLALNARGSGGAWERLLLTQASMQLDEGTTAGERALIRRLKSMLSPFSWTRADGEDVDAGRSSELLTALENSIRRRSSNSR